MADEQTSGRCRRCDRPMDDHCLLHSVTGCPPPSDTACNVTGTRSQFRLKEEDPPPSTEWSDQP